MIMMILLLFWYPHLLHWQVDSLPLAPSGKPYIIVKNTPAMQETWVWSLRQEDPLEKGMPTHSSILPGEFHGQRSLVVYSSWGHKSDTTELSHFHFFPIDIILYYIYYWASQVVLVVKNPPANAGDIGNAGSGPGSGRSPEGGHGNPLLPGESHGQRRLVGYSPWGREWQGHLWAGRMVNLGNSRRGFWAP